MPLLQPDKEGSAAAQPARGKRQAAMATGHRMPTLRALQASFPLRQNKPRQPARPARSAINMASKSCDGKAAENRNPWP
jgi:hypothetical protein